MSTFEASAHPRGQVANAGQFREKVNDAPGEALSEATKPDGHSQWRILADRLIDFSKAVDKENRRLERAGVEKRFTFTHERKVWRDENGRPWVVEDITLNRPCIAVGNWQFLAQHEKTAAGAIITYQTGAAGDEHVVGDPSMRCDHCGQFRSRQKVFTLRDRETGELKQIGSNCIALFLGTKPEGLWAMAREVGEELSFDENDASSGSRAPNAFDGDQLLLATLRQIELDDGDYVSRSRASMTRVATVDKVTGQFTALTIADPTLAETAEIAAIIDWVDGLEPDANDDYLQNLAAALTRSDDGELVVYAKHAGLAVSAVSAYRRHIARQAEREVKATLAERKLAEFAYTQGESLKGKGLELTVVSMREGYDYGYGAPTHVTLMDDAGHVFYWKSTGALGAHVTLADGAGYYFLPQEGGRLRVAGGSVKEHRISDFNGDHETVIWRVKVEPLQATLDEFEADHAADLAARSASVPA